MESKSFGLSLLQCYSDDENSNTDDKSSILNVLTENPSTSGSEHVANFSSLEAANTTENEKKDVNTKILDVPLGLENQSHSLHTMQEPVVEFPLNYRVINHNSDSESESSSDESALTVPIDFDLNVSVEENESNVGTSNKGVPPNNKSKMLEDLGILDLAPLEDLKISVPEEECIPIGVVHKIIDPLVIVSAKKGCPAIDLDSVLFLDHGKTFLGQVFDVFGQVSEPMYMVRFNSLQHIIEQGIQVGMEVYFAPRTRHTAFVFVDALFKQKGSDASWENDQEPPEGCLDYSDDEQERRAKAAHRLKKNPRGNAEDAGNTVNPCKKRQTKFHRSRGQEQEHLIEQPQVNPFYMLPSSGYPPYNPPPNSSYSTVAPNSNLVAPVISTTEDSAIPSPYVYPPCIPITQNLTLSLPSGEAENHTIKSEPNNQVSLPQPDNSIQKPPIL
ncbi:H/ACA ribonucleoprotein complex non-core subunit NAF1-like [Daphnia pulex]|uniref:H/ACA ribonucleoprotein complex non-core subunit NAF1-like n=1 Tax=Daphnia pulex TaxID=6669 RepID=UPI001EE10A00|nr:H/ACA ribonucleoprotein complex non-core subunit NAF1-like [Daphnia pulex]